ncbi:MAG: hypothetical protein GEU94_11895 [Micromonosporaceae bacterium]|nr:hypothetical protein [Micromonosporaceae bacterium]
MWWLVGAVVLIVLVATYLTWIAARVDRLHHRAAAAYSALDAQLVRRAAAAMALADIDPSLRELARPLRKAARAAQQASAGGREIAENRLTKLLRESAPHAGAPPPRAWRGAVSSSSSSSPGSGSGSSSGDGPLVGRHEDPAAAAVAEVISASRRVALARQVHTDLVRDTLAARRRPVARLLGLDRRHARPAYFDIEDPVLDT